jgi:hypothetical protein
VKDFLNTIFEMAAKVYCREFCLFCCVFLLWVAGIVYRSQLILINLQTLSEKKIERVFTFGKKYMFFFK